MTGVLSHIRVLDLSRVLAGPWAGQIFADLGAEVIKVERPGRGDDTRAWGPPYLKDEQGADTSESAYFMSANRGKKSITVDITQPRGQALLRELATRSDVLIENFKVGGLAKYGLDYTSLKALNPNLIYCSITGFGQSGPYDTAPGYDFMIQAMSGLMSVTGEPGGMPQKAGVALSDILTGMYAVTAVQAALLHRERGGEGQHIDLALLDVQVACMANQAMNYLTSGVSPQRMGNAHPNVVPYQVFATADGHLIIAVGNDGQFGRLCEVLELADMATDARFATNAARIKHREALIPALQAALMHKDSAQWLAIFKANTIPAGPINNLEQVFADPQVQHRGMQVELSHPTAGKAPLVGSPLNLSATPVEYQRPPPVLGEHTDEVLRDVLEMDAAGLEDLKQAGVV